MFARRIRLTGRPATPLISAFLLPLAQDQTGTGIPWWVWVILIVLLLLLLYWWFTRPQEPEPPSRAESRQAAPPPPAPTPAAPPPTPAAPDMPAMMEMAPTPIEPAPLPTPPTPDDLVMIEGIGPKINSLLQSAGITTFSQLANTDPGHLRHILEEANLKLADPTSWPEQARLAAAGSWEALQAMQDQLKAGR